MQLVQKLKTLVFPLVGMMFFWGFFRYQSFFGALYPVGSLVSAASSAFSTHAAFLCVLTAAAVAAGIMISRTNLPIRRAMWIVVGGTVAGTLGVGLAFLVNYNGAPAWLLWISATLVAVGFLIEYLAWAYYCSRTYSKQNIIMLTASYCLSLVVCVGLVRYSSTATNAIALLTPLVTGLTWCLSDHSCASAPQVEPALENGRIMGAGTPSDAPAADSGTVPDAGRKGLGALLHDVPIYVVLFPAFLICGAVIRGVVDMTSVYSTIRWPLSVITAIVMFLACVILKRRSDRLEHSTSRMSNEIILGSWIVLAALYFIGVVWGLAVGTYVSAGHLVVVSRSMLDFVLWMLLCDVALRTHARPYSVFLAFGIVTEIASWALSYVIVPNLLSASLAGSSFNQDVLVLGALLVLLVMMVVAFGTMHMPQGDDDSGKNAGGSVAGSASSAASLDIDDIKQAVGENGGEVVAQLSEEAFRAATADYRLTPREAEVALYFSQGYSIKRISEMLCVSTGTVQSHLKGAYRKLEIHSRDELIKLIRG